MKTQFLRFLAIAFACSLLLAALPGTVSAQDPPRYSPWSAPVNIGPPVNSADWADMQPFLSPDGLSLYFTRLCSVPGCGDTNSNTGFDIWTSHRASLEDLWDPPVKLPDTINTASFNDVAPFLTVDGHWLYFVSTRTTADKNGLPPFGNNDIYVARRLNKREDFGPKGWQEPENLGSGVNTASGEAAPFIFEDEQTGVTTLYFQSNRPGGQGAQDIYAATLQPDGTFGDAQPVTELNSPYSDQQPMISRNGLEMYFTSNRPGSQLNRAGQPSSDIWVSTRASTSDPWGAPRNLDEVNLEMGGPVINSPYEDPRPMLSFDGTVLLFASAYRTGNQSIYFDIWMCTRSKITGQQ